MPGIKGSIASITQARDNITNLIELFVDCSGMNLNIRVGFRQLGNAFGRGNKTAEIDVFYAALFHDIDSGNSGSTSGEHRVENI